uniref:RRM domain-containing protein n=1 Tax=Strigamia maritima TaxID=126957 RepID=T1J3A5_STRMM
MEYENNMFDADDEFGFGRILREMDEEEEKNKNKLAKNTFIHSSSDNKENSGNNDKLEKQQCQITNVFRYSPILPKTMKTVDKFSSSNETKIEIDSRTIYIGNVAFCATTEELKRHFNACGFIKRVSIVSNKITGRPRGFAYIEFTDKNAVNAALVLNNSLFRERKIVVHRYSKNSALNGRSLARKRFNEDYSNLSRIKSQKIDEKESRMDHFTYFRPNQWKKPLHLGSLDEKSHVIPAEQLLNLQLNVDYDFNEISTDFAFASFTTSGTITEDEWDEYRHRGESGEMDEENFHRNSYPEDDSDFEKQRDYWGDYEEDDFSDQLKNTRLSNAVFDYSDINTFGYGDKIKPKSNSKSQMSKRDYLKFAKTFERFKPKLSIEVEETDEDKAILRAMMCH